MGVIIDTLTSESFRKRPAMYAGSERFAELAWWIRGLEYGCLHSLPESPKELDGFREYLHMHLDGPGNIDWQGLIAWKFGAGTEATQKAFEYLDQFLQEVSRHGKDRIIAEHADYEKRRYGSLSSSRLDPNGPYAKSRQGGKRQT
jgi:hypothetical protein